MNASDVLIETIHAWGVDVVFGLPGDGINGIIEALRKAKDKIRFIQVRHEEGAAFISSTGSTTLSWMASPFSPSPPGHP